MVDREMGDKLALLTDPMDLAMVQDYVEGMQTHSRFSVYALRQMARTPWDSCIIHTRLNQVDLFSTPQEGPYSLGFAIKMKDHAATPKSADKKEIERLTTLMMQCGEYQQPHHKFTRPAFGQFLREITYDSMVLDAMTFEIVPAYKKLSKDGMPMPVMWHPVDAGTIFRAAPNNPYNEYEADDCHYMQIISEQQVARWRPGELAYATRRSRTDLTTMGYGYPELCEMVDIVTGLLYGLVHNMNYFKQGGPRGVLAVMGQMPEKQFRFFQKQFLYAASGVKNAFRMILANPQGADADLKWVPFGMPNKDMEFAEWNNFLFKLMCSLRQIDPSEVGINYGNDGGKQPLFMQSPEAKIQSGRDKGLRPLLNFIQRTLNLYIVERLNPDFEIRFLGVGSMSEKDEAELDTTLLKGPRTINEVRAIKDLPSIGPEGDVLADPSWLQYHQSGVDRPQEEGSEDGMPGQGGEFGDLGAIGGQGGGIPGQAPGGPEGAAGGPGEASTDEELLPPPGFDDIGKALADKALQRLAAFDGTGPDQSADIYTVAGFPVEQRPPMVSMVDYNPVSMRNAPIENVRLTDLIATQPEIDKVKIENFIRHPELGAHELPVVARKGGRMYILDGHHRMAAARLMGKGRIPAHVLTLEDAEKDIDRAMGAVGQLLKIEINL